MILAVIAFLGGALTILSPCTLPVLPFVFAKTERPFVRSTLPLLIGMALTFAAVATLAAVGGSWAVRVNTYGRILALIVLGLFGLALLSTRLADWLARPAVALGNRLLQSDTGGGADAAQSFVLGVATGLLWAPCAGPILGLILTGAAINGPGANTTLLLLAYAGGAMASLALATLAGRQVFAAMKRSLGVSEWLRRALGALVLAAVIVIALGWDTGILTQVSLGSTSRLEQSLLAALRPASQAQQGTMAMKAGASSGAMTGGAMTGGAMTARAMSGGAMSTSSAAASSLPIEGEMPSLSGAVAWLNSPPLTAQDLRGKVVLIDFWTYSCINCLRTLPYVKSWYERYKDHGLIIIGVHSPEFAFEKDVSNVQRAVHDLGITYPVAVDSDYAIWRAFANQYWPADYLVDAMGHIREHHFGEGDYDGSELAIRELLMQAGHTDLPSMSGQMRGQGIQAAADESDIQSPETYIGYERAENFSSPGSLARDSVKTYVVPSTLQLNQWALGGRWLITAEHAALQSAPGTIAYRFHARDLHLVLGPDDNGKPIRFRVSIDGHEPGMDHGTDTDEHGLGVVREQRLYQLIRQSGAVGEHTFRIEFLDTGVKAYSFTFG
jgi:cytochrome c biogenesis protein CcdA/thiol-disulfide isomerase/thioredoxin